MSALLTDTNTTDVERLVMRDATLGHLGHRLFVFFEHGQWWVEDKDTGAQWSACDCDGPNGERFCF